MSRVTFRIYYEDTDFSGFVYHARYLHFLERARTEFLRELGVDQRAMFEAPAGPSAFVVREVSIQYRSPARMDDLIEVTAELARLGGASLVMAQRIERGGQVLCMATIQIAFLVKGRPSRLPPEMRARLEALIKD